MKPIPLLALFTSVILTAGTPVSGTTTFTTNTAIGVGNTNYDQTDIVVTNCTVTIDGLHLFSSLRVEAGGLVTHSFYPGGVISNILYITNEAQVLTSTNPVTLLNSNVLPGTVIVADSTGTNFYTNGLDYLLTSTNGILTELERTTNSDIPDGSTVLVSYESLLGTTPAGLDLNIASNVQVDATGAISANGVGYGGGLGTGAGHESFVSSQDASGGGYGGNGGNSSSNAIGGMTYGSFYGPANVGSGGGASYAGAGGSGGGLVHILAGGAVILNGSVSANGANATNSRAGGGSGGGVWISGLTLAGAGTITANGGSGDPSHGGGGGGGRISLEYVTSTYAGSMTAYGGAGANPGGAGTIYTEINGTSELLVFDNGSQPGTNLTTASVSDYGLTVIDRGNATVHPSGNWEVGSLTVASNGLFLTGVTTPINLTVSNALTVETGGQINANSAGYAGGQGQGAGRYYGENDDVVGGGGGYGGAGAIIPSTSFEDGGETYGLETSPNGYFGSGGGGEPPTSPGGNGGGLIEIFSLGGLVQVDGVISANGGNGSGLGGGGGSGGTVTVTGGILLGSGAITANGGNGAESLGGGGGGGRILVNVPADQFNGTISAYGGSGGGGFGGAGTVYMEVSGQNTQLILDNDGNNGTNTPVTTASSADLIVRGGAIGTVSSGLATFANLYLNSNGWLAPYLYETGDPGDSVSFSFNGNAIIQAGGGINANLAGYPAQQGNGEGRSSVLGSTNIGSGAGHGGYGGNGAYGLLGGITYDLPTNPNLPGSGGGTTSVVSPGGAGGGVIHLTVNGTLEVDGTISANGGNGSGLAGGGGAGGSISVTAGALSGAGSISANGGNGSSALGGGGGGGMVFLDCNNNVFAGTVAVYGGSGANWGGAGTEVIQTPGKNLQLILDDDGNAGPATPLLNSSTTDLTLRNGAIGLVTSGLTLGNLVISSNSWLLVSNTTSLVAMSFSTVTIQPGGGITADFQGSPAGQGTGPGKSYSTQPNYPCGGAGHGGLGANAALVSGSSGSGGNAYDSETQPNLAGSGGGTYSPYSLGGAGGGAFAVSVTGLLQVDGIISANGASGTGSGGGGGSGGAIKLTAGTLVGAGTIRANGGAGANLIGGGGGGGCIEINPTADEFTGTISAYGGGAANVGGAGTIYLQVAQQTAQLILDNNGNPGTNTPLQTASSADLIVRNGAIASASSSVSFDDLIVNSNGWLAPYYYQLTDPADSLVFSFNGNATIQAGGGIVANTAGSAGGQGYGSGYTYTFGSTNLGGGGANGGNGGASFGDYAAGATSTSSYLTSPSQSGGGGGTLTPSAIGGTGGGVIHLTVNGTLELDGTISANGGNGSGEGGGGGAGGSILLSVGTLAGSGSITASGGAGANLLGGGGGGGAIAVDASADEFTGGISAYGGGGANFGGAGTVYLQITSQIPQLILDNDGNSGTNTPVQSVAGADLIVRNGAIASASSTVTFEDLIVNSNGWLAPYYYESGEQPYSIAFSFTRNATIQAGGGIVANSDGYAGGQGSGAGHNYAFGSTNLGSGAGHGGNGGASFGNFAAGGTTYDSLTAPADAGSGGGTDTPYSIGGAGGGMVHLTVTGTLQVDGIISANGGNGSGLAGGGGAGGGIWLAVGTLAGAGSITANGGNGADNLGGGGGGGMIYIPCSSANAFSGPITAYGGSGANEGGPGTTVIQVPGKNSQLILDAGGNAGAGTPLPSSSTIDVTLRNGAAGLVTGSISSGNLVVGPNSVLSIDTGSTQIPSLTFVSVNVQAGGAISADAVGSLAGEGTGAGKFYGLAPDYACSGGGHGGVGGPSLGNLATGGAAYDTQSSPAQAGSGGGTYSTYSFGGAGGGGVFMTVSGLLQVDGLISANGANGSGIGGGGGSGGIVKITAGTLAGGGVIRANGGSGANSIGGGGAGGCIALSPTANLFAGTISAYGGGGANWGGPGTIYLQNSTQAPQWILNNAGQPGPPTPIQSVSSSAVIIITNGASAYPQFESQTFASLMIATNAWLVAGTNVNPGIVNLTLTGNATLEAGGGIVTDAQGPSGGLGTGAGHGYSNLSDDDPCGGGGYGGNGGSGGNGIGSLAAGGLVYASVTSPTSVGSAGGTVANYSPGGSGGGAIRLVVNGTLDVSGRISANGTNGSGLGGGGGSGGSIYLTVGTMIGNGSITANGGAGVNNIGGGGGGGRISIGYSANSFEGAMSARGGEGAIDGGAGTIYSKANSQSVGLVLVDNGGTNGADTPLASNLGLPSQPFNLTIQNGGTVCPQTSYLFPELNNLTVASNGLLTETAGLTTLDVLVFNDVEVAQGGVIAVDGEGYGQGTGPGAGLFNNNAGSGAGYGGPGGASSAAVGGPSYGSATQPTDFGSGGGFGSGNSMGGSSGGGALRLNIGGVLTVNGEISAAGEPGLQDSSGGGSGGSIWMDAGVFVGDGLMTANGGEGQPYNGGGGAGGRIALYSSENAFFGLAAALGGLGASAGASGTVVISNSIPLLQVISNSPNGTISNAVSSIILFFNGAPNPNSVVPSDMVLQTPNGPVTNSITVSMLTSSSYEVTFAEQTTNGAYALDVSTNIVDLYGRPLAQAYAATFVVSLPVIQGMVTDTNGDPASGVTVQSSEGTSTTTDVHGNYVLGFVPGTFTVTPSSGSLAFTPPSISYTNMTTSVSNQNYTVLTSFGLSLTAGVNGTNFVLGWQAASGISYQVYTSTDLVNWSPYGPPLVASNGQAQVVVPMTNSPQFFSVQGN